MSNYFKVEWQHFIHNRKNQVIFLILFLLGMYYALVQVPQYLPAEAINSERMTADFNNRKKFLETVTPEEKSHFSTMYLYSIYPQWNELEEQRIQAVAKEDYQAYAKVASQYYAYSDQVLGQSPIPDLTYHESYYYYGNYYASQDGHFGYRRTAKLYQDMAELAQPLTKAAIHEKTALQTFYRASRVLLPIILTVAVILLRADSYFKDQQHSSVLAFYPLTKLKRRLVKLSLGMVSLFVSCLMFVPSFILVGIQFGFGHWRYPVPIFSGDYINEGSFTSITIGDYSGRFFLLLLLWGLMLNLLLLVLSYVFKNQLLTIILPLSLVLMELLYNRRGIGVNQRYLYFPSSYIRIGAIIDGSRSFFYVNQFLTYERGLVVLALTTALLLLLLIIESQVNFKGGRRDA